MPIVNLDPQESPKEPEKSLPEAIQEPHKSTFTALVPETKLNSLLKYVEGYPWTVDYYGQVLTDNTTLEAFDPTTPSIVQSYYKVNQLVLSVSSPLTSTYNEESGVTTVTGSAITPYKVKPNVGDLFIAKVDNDEDAIFHITNVTRKTYRKDSVYEVDYALFGYVSAYRDFYDNLQSKVNEVYFFNQDAKYTNKDHLITPEVKYSIDHLKKYLRQSQDYYFNTFYSTRTGTLFLPDLYDNIFDQYLVQFILETVELTHSNLIKTSLFNFDNLPSDENMTLLNAIRQRDPGLIDYSTFKKQVKYYSVIVLKNNIRLATPWWLDIDAFALPVPEPKLEENGALSGVDLYAIKNNKNYPEGLYNPTITTVHGSVQLLPALHEEDYYIVSKHFYEALESPDPASISFFEFLLMKYLYNEAISHKDLVILIQDHAKWSRLHQFYLLPVCWQIIKNYI